MRVAFVDTGDTSPVSFWWRTGAGVFASSFDHVVKVKSRDDFYEKLAGFAGHGPVDAQLWSHGRAGQPLINGKALDPKRSEWRGLKGGSIWFRACDVADSLAGQTFMSEIVKHDVSAVAHLVLTGSLMCQSYLVGLRPHQLPWWDVGEVKGGSAPWLPHTVLATQMTLPSWAFDRGF